MTSTRGSRQDSWFCKLYSVLNKCDDLPLLGIHIAFEPTFLAHRLFTLRCQKGLLALYRYIEMTYMGILKSYPLSKKEKTTASDPNGRCHLSRWQAFEHGKCHLI